MPELKHPDSEVEKDVLADYYELLGSDNNNTRCDAATDLLRYGGIEGVRLLIKAMGSGNTERYNVAAWALTNMGGLPRFKKDMDQAQLDERLAEMMPILNRTLTDTDLQPGLTYLNETLVRSLHLAENYGDASVLPSLGILLDKVERRFEAEGYRREYVQTAEYGGWIDNDWVKSVQRVVEAVEKRTGARLKRPEPEVVVQGSLMWQLRCDGVKRTQAEAFAYCRALRLGGYSDWRLPTLREFEVLGRNLESAYTDYWTSTDEPQLGREVAYINDGTTMFRTNEYYVRAVRSVSQSKTQPAERPAPLRPQPRAEPPRPIEQLRSAAQPKPQPSKRPVQVAMETAPAEQATVAPTPPAVGTVPTSDGEHVYDDGSDAGVQTVAYATFIQRLLALLIDTLFLRVVVGALNRILGAMALPLGSVYIGIVSLSALYSIVMVASKTRGTIGKMMLGLAVVDRQGRQVSVWASLVRVIVSYISALPFCAGYVLMAFSPTRQAWHDAAAHTYVVVRPRR